MDTKNTSAWVKFGLYLLYAVITFSIYKIGVTFQFLVTKHIALQNSLNIIHFEKHWHLFIEPIIQNWSLSSKPIIHFFDFFYNAIYPLGLFSALIYLWIIDRKNFSKHSDALLFMLFASACIYYLYPVMPPRLMADCSQWGMCMKHFPIIDTIATNSKPNSFRLDSLTAVANYYAAMPSMHVGVSSFVAYSFYHNLRTRLLKIIALLYPLFMFITVLATGNHYFLDTLAGFAIYFIALVAVGPKNADQIINKNKVQST